MSAADIELEVWRAGDAPVPEVFAPLDPARRQAEWEWAFARNPAGPRLVLARRAGVLAAHGAGLGVRTRVLGETRGFTHVLTGALGAQVGRDEPAALAAARALHEEFLRPELDLVHYGWPDAHARALGRQHLEQERLKVQSLLVRAPVAAPAPSSVPASALVRTLTRFGPEADVLYACCATHWNASAIRDAAFLNWRYAEHPRRRYRMLALQNGDTLRGYAVQRAGDELGPRLELLLDWLVLPGDEEAAEALLAAALAGAEADGAPALVTAIPEWSPWSLWFQQRGFLHHPSEHVEVVRGAQPRFDMLWLRDNWWTTLGDALDL